MDSFLAALKESRRFCEESRVSAFENDETQEVGGGGGLGGRYRLFMFVAGV